MDKHQTNDITTRLLAQENLLIQRAPVTTASFDVVNRVLTLPQWQNMTPEIEEMLKAHEVAHALYTDFTIFEKAKATEERKGIPHGFCNILEDARIEKLMKRKYPGLRSAFAKGYKQLNERDFFGVKKHELASLQLIDRINLYYKAGFECGVKFTPAEKYLVDQVARLETVDDVINLARKVYDFTKKQKQDILKSLEGDAEYKKMLEEHNQIDDDYDDLDALDDDFDFDDEENRHEYEESGEDTTEPKEDRDDITGRGAGADSDNIKTEETVKDPVTVKSFEEKLAESADVNTRYQYIDMVRFGPFIDDIIVPYKQVLNDHVGVVDAVIKKTIDGGYEHRINHIMKLSAQQNIDYDKFMQETQRVVSYLVKEFEMRKAATDYKRVQIAKSGVLDVRKLSQYKIREDLFKSINITKDGKKHGMIFVLDWSGSMSEYLNDTVKQLISLVMFCHRIKIPFQVFAFSDNKEMKKSVEVVDPSWSQEYREQLRYQNYKNDIHKLIGDSQYVLEIRPDFSMIELFSNRMTTTEFNKMCKTVFGMSLGFVADNYELGGTPLNESLAFLYDYSEKFILGNQIEKFTLIKLTDGDGGRVTSCMTKNVATGDPYAERYGYTSSNINSTHTYENNTRVRYVRFLRCPITKKVYQIEPHTQWGNLLTKLIKDRYNCGTIGFHVTDKRSRDINYAMNTYLLPTNDVVVYNVRRDMLKEGFAALDVEGHDELFLLKSDHKVDEQELTEDMTKMTAAAIAKQFGKHLSAKKTSRVLLNRFVGVVA
jgi:hypothetical protein